MKKGLNKNMNYNKIPALTPPMGWNSFNSFDCSPSEALIKETADAFIANGLKDAGYEYINIDDGWMLPERDTDGSLVINPEMFPNGFKPLTDYVHSLGLKIGIYLGCGIRTYNEKAGSLGYEFKDAQAIAGWGFDYLKYDNREIEGEDPPRCCKSEYLKMALALKKTGRDILFSMCEHGKTEPWLWAYGVGQMWRTTPDIKNLWDGQLDTWALSFNTIVDRIADSTQPYGGTCRWNDPDMLIVGMYKWNDWTGPGCTDAEYRAHFSLWCLMASPLIIGCDVRKLNDVTKATLTNKNLIAVNQDILGIGAKRIRSAEGIDVWVKPLSDVSWAVGLYNRTCVAANISVNWEELNLPASLCCSVKDLWTDKELGVFERGITLKVDSHAMDVIKITPAF
ncbi:MAG: glycoside hydrolase family 27 protein [Oscillospiraceae bacterium]|nr:glycoside hydrolase family 27 protein [Oscillospiraceae bacterium]